mgnify:CR=1 FL=1
MNPHPFSMGDIVEVNGRRGRIVSLFRNLAIDLVEEITVKFEDNGGREWFCCDDFDDIELVEEAQSHDVPGHHA